MTIAKALSVTLHSNSSPFDVRCHEIHFEQAGHLLLNSTAWHHYNSCLMKNISSNIKIIIGMLQQNE
jgi:hypothetical protein